MSKELDLKQLLEAKLGNITPVSNNADIIEHIERKIPTNLMYDESATELKEVVKTSTHMSTSKRLTLEQYQNEYDDLNKFVETFLVNGTDYGILPQQKSKKPCLYKIGALKLVHYFQYTSKIEITRRYENYDSGVFSYEVIMRLYDKEGCLCSEGVGIANSRENKYTKMDSFSIQNVLIKMAKKRALVDAVLSCGNLSEFFTQDINSINEELLKDERITNHFEEPTKRKITDKQIKYVETLLKLHNIPNDSLKRHIEHTYNINDLTQLSGSQASELIELIKSM